MRVAWFVRASWAALALPAAANADAPASTSAGYETREEYLARLREICAVDCLEPRPFQRTARRRSGRSGEMAVIMDVAFVRRNGERFELFSMDVSSSPLEVVELLGSAGIDTSQSSGVGGLPRGRRGALHPDVIVVSLDAQAFSDILNPVSSPPAGSAPAPGPQAPTGPTPDGPTPGGQGSPAPSRTGPDGRIIVDGAREAEAEKEVRKPNLTNLRTYFRNRRIVARGEPQLQAQWIGGRLDRRRKQVTLMVDNADDLVLLPRYDAKGEPILEGPLAGLAAAP